MSALQTEEEKFPEGPYASKVPSFPPQKIAPSHAAPFAELGVCIGQFVVWFLLNSFSTGLIGQCNGKASYTRVTRYIDHDQPYDVPDLGWVLFQSLGAGGYFPGMIIATVAPVIAMLFAIMYISLTQDLNFFISFVNIYVIIMTVRMVALLVTYHPRLNSVHENRAKIFKKSMSKVNTGYSIDPSGHTIAIMLPIFFIAIATSLAGTEQRNQQLGASAMVALIPVAYIWYFHMHHTSSVVVSVGLSMLAAYAATEYMVGWQSVLVALAIGVFVLALNLTFFGMPKKFGIVI
jgi:hypothetical protein